ncbi:MAG: aminotransferase class V-fold PLP-dependent enzyme, partial [Planctomycetes bacterium]|nr:aminotransferase class V-fold PLP-dependent enzyme [Planctomycetota bacterium]
MKASDYVYCDHAAGAPCRPEARAEWAAYATHEYANPGAHHPLAYLARRKLIELHERAAGVLGVDPREIVFTSGGTESDLLALRGVMKSALQGRNELVVSGIEHHAVLLEAQRLESEGTVVHYAPVTRDGVVDLDALKALVGPRTALVSVMYANNETGVVQPVRQVAEIARRDLDHQVQGGTVAVGLVALVDVGVPGRHGHCLPLLHAPVIVHSCDTGQKT